MNIEFINPGVDYMLQRIMDFQTEAESAFWSEPLYHFYPQLDKVYAISLPFAERKNYIERTMRAVYAELEDTINEKVALYTRHWNACKPQITAALSDAFGVDCANLFNDIRCNLSMNPIEPRFLKERCYDTFYLNSERGAIGGGIHEIIHFVWFYVWNSTFSCSDTGVYEDFYIEPAFRGKGIARKLAQAAQAWCKDNGISSLTVCCAPCDEKMYQALGFDIALVTTFAHIE